MSPHLYPIPRIVKSIHSYTSTPDQNPDQKQKQNKSTIPIHLTKKPIIPYPPKCPPSVNPKTNTSAPSPSTRPNKSGTHQRDATRTSNSHSHNPQSPSLNASKSSVVLIPGGPPCLHFPRRASRHRVAEERGFAGDVPGGIGTNACAEEGDAGSKGGEGERREGKSEAEAEEGG